jgi:hypothetical protein
MCTSTNSTLRDGGKIASELEAPPRSPVLTAPKVARPVAARDSRIQCLLPTPLARSRVD